MNDPEQVRKRAKLSLPTPQITDEELEQIAKMEESDITKTANYFNSFQLLLVLF